MLDSCFSVCPPQKQTHCREQTQKKHNVLIKFWCRNNSIKKVTLCKGGRTTQNRNQTLSTRKKHICGSHEWRKRPTHRGKEANKQQVFVFERSITHNPPPKKTHTHTQHQKQQASKEPNKVSTLKTRKAPSRPGKSTLKNHKKHPSKHRNNSKPEKHPRKAPSTPEKEEDK